MNLPLGKEYLRLVEIDVGNVTAETTKNLERSIEQLEMLGTSLSAMYQAASCHRKCFGDPHMLERLLARSYNLATASYSLVRLGLYDEALTLIRSMGEILNLIILSVVDKKSMKDWLAASDKERIQKFGPAKVRHLLEKANSPFPIYVSQEWYSYFCETFTHVTPEFRPNSHNQKKLYYVGGVFQEEGLEFTLDELVKISVQIATLAAKYTEMDDIIEALASVANAS